MSPRLRLALLVIAAVVAAQFLVRSLEGAGEAGPTPEGMEAPALALETLDGRRVDLRELRGRVVAVNFWATWCPPCRAEMPRLSEVWRTRHDRCFELLGVAGMSPRADTQAAARSLPFPVLFDEGGDAVSAWSVRAFPRTFLVDPDGRVRRVFRGAVGEQELAREVDALLPASCPARSG
jgi:cytochrome c biogenesis protein CcmG/thiol:disulfide interchange protein DsbE